MMSEIPPTHVCITDSVGPHAELFSRVNKDLGSRIRAATEEIAL